MCDPRKNALLTTSLTYTHGRASKKNPSAYINGIQNAQIYTERDTASYVIGGATWIAETGFGYNLNDALT